jgi:hypothetical protein
MRYPKQFFDLNFRFAQKVAKLSNQACTDVLVEYTTFYLSFNLGRRFDPTHPGWQEYLKGLRQSDDPIAWTAQFYLSRQKKYFLAAPRRAKQRAFGCFSYAVWPEQKIRIHFQNNESSKHRPLSPERMALRVGELKAMFAHIKEHVEEPTTVVGGSWLYNIAAYRRLFPAAYLRTAQVGQPEFAYLSLWGQFLDRHWQVKEAVAAKFLACLSKQLDLAALTNCFPFQVLRLEAPIEHFYQLYRI